MRYDHAIEIPLQDLGDGFARGFAVANYHSTISVSPDPKGSSLKWVGKYDAKGAPDADAKKVIDGIYESGEKALVGG